MIRRAQRPEAGYLLVANELARDQRLSFRARGLLEAILSRPDDWETTSERLASESPSEGRDAIRTALLELRAAGYARVVKVRGDDGRLRTETLIYDEPLTDPVVSIDIAPQSTGPVSTGSALTDALVTPETAHPAPVEPATTSSQVTPETDNPAPVEPASDEPAPDNPASYKEPGDKEPPPGTPEAEDPIDDPDPAVDAQHAFIDALRTRIPDAPRWLGSRAATPLAAGWTIPQLVDAILADPLDDARSIPAVLAARLNGIGRAPSAITTPRRNTPAWCGLCDQDTRLRRSTAGTCSRCPVCHPLTLRGVAS